MPGGDVKENGCEILKVDRYLSIQLRVLLNKELYGINCKKRSPFAWVYRYDA